MTGVLGLRDLLVGGSQGLVSLHGLSATLVLCLSQGFAMCFPTSNAVRTRFKKLVLTFSRTQDGAA